MIEKIIYKRLYSNKNINNVLVKEQFGVRTNAFTEIAVYILINNILQSLNNKLLVGGLFCDLRIAFEILLSKMRFCGVVGLANKVIKSYLPDRCQSVLINIENSNIFLNGSK
jgi:hypothetical protein